jgi:hypothetical protein
MPDVFGKYFESSLNHPLTPPFFERLIMNKKASWNTAQWIAFGNRVKNVRKELQALIKDMQPVARATEIANLIAIERKLDKWKSRMENLAAKDVTGAILTHIFYGEPIPELTQLTETTAHPLPATSPHPKNTPQ